MKDDLFGAPLQWMFVLVLLPLLAIQTFAQHENEEDKCCCSTAETGQCLIGVKKKVDEALNDSYRRALAKGKDQAAVTAKLREVERPWIQYRDANCESERRTYEGGSMASNMWGFCQIRLTRQRTEKIQNVYLNEP